MYQSKTVEVRIVQFHRTVAHPSFCGLSLSRNSNGFSLTGGVKQDGGRENELFSSFMRAIGDVCHGLFVSLSVLIKLTVTHKRKRYDLQSRMTEEIDASLSDLPCPRIYTV